MSSACLNVCVHASGCAFRREIAGGRKGVLFLQGSWQTYSPLLISFCWLIFEMLCPSPPLSISLHSWDGRHGDHSWEASPTGSWEHLARWASWVWCSLCVMTCCDLSQRFSALKHHLTTVCSYPFILHLRVKPLLFRHIYLLWFYSYNHLLESVMHSVCGTTAFRQIHRRKQRCWFTYRQTTTQIIEAEVCKYTVWLSGMS